MENKRLFSPIRMPVKADKVIHISTLLLAVFGLIMVTSASMGLAVGDNAYLIRTVIRQLVFTIAGYIAMIFVSKQFSFKLLRDNTMLLIVLTLGFLLFALAFKAVGGARAWIRLPFPGIEVTLQPSEFAKISIICVIASYLGDLKKMMPKPEDIYRGPAVFLGASIFIVMFLQSDFGSAAVMAFIGLVCFMIPRHPQLKRIQRIILFLFILGFILAAIVLSPIGEQITNALPLQGYQKNRILSSINPFIDRYGTGYQLINGLISFASGGFFGVGFGNSVRKYTNFPAANTDFILAIVVEELGFLGFLFIFILYFLIIYRLFKYIFIMKSEKGQIILVGTAMYIFIHFLLNVGGVTGLIPLTGVPLLMISSGGSSTLSLMVAIGVSQAVINEYEHGEIR